MKCSGTLHVDLLVRVDALEVDVQDLLLRTDASGTSRTSTCCVSRLDFMSRMDAWNASASSLKQQVLWSSSIGAARLVGRRRGCRAPCPLRRRRRLAPVPCMRARYTL